MALVVSQKVEEWNENRMEVTHEVALQQVEKVSFEVVLVLLVEVVVMLLEGWMMLVEEVNYPVVWKIEVEVERL